MAQCRRVFMRILQLERLGTCSRVVANQSETWCHQPAVSVDVDIEFFSSRCLLCL